MKYIAEIGRNPRIDWIITLFLTVGISLVLAIQGLYLYNAVSQGSIRNDSNAAISKTVKEFNGEALSMVIDRFSQKAELGKKAKAGYSGMADPSI